MFLRWLQPQLLIRVITVIKFYIYLNKKGMEIPILEKIEFKKMQDFLISHQIYLRSVINFKLIRTVNNKIRLIV
jgi:hypothetical protein